MTDAGAEAAARLRTMADGTTAEAALALFDALPPAAEDDLLGAWRGSELPTGNPLDGALTRLGWHGKWVQDRDTAHPLVFRRRDGGLTALDPARVPLQLVLRAAPLLRSAPASAVFALARPLLVTARPGARVRTVRHRGLASAALVYDDLPVIDVFRRVDDLTLLAAMDARGVDRPYLFVLRRERLPGPAAPHQRPRTTPGGGHRP